MLHMRSRKFFPRLPRPLWFLLGGTFFNKVGTLVVPFLAVYLTTVRGLSVSQAAFVVALFGIGSFGASLSGGFFADIFGRRVTMLASLVLSAVAMLVLGMVQTLPFIAFFTIVLGYCTDLYRPAVSAVIADLIPSEGRVQAYGLRYWANNMGASIGPVIAGALVHISYAVLFIGDALSTLVFGLVVWLGIPETRPQYMHLRKRIRKEHEKLEEGVYNGRAIWRALLHPLMLGHIVLIFMATCLYEQYGVTMPLDMLRHGLDASQYGIALAANGVVIVLLSIPLSNAVARFSRLVVLAVAAALLGIGFGLMGFIPGVSGYILPTMIWTCGEMLCFPVANAAVADIAPVTLRGTYQGLFQAARSLASFVAPIAGGALLEHFGSAPLWISCLALGVITAGGYLALHSIHTHSLRNVPVQIEASSYIHEKAPQEVTRP